jgi:hypothetical protein
MGDTLQRDVFLKKPKTKEEIPYLSLKDGIYGRG